MAPTDSDVGTLIGPRVGPLGTEWRTALAMTIFAEASTQPSMISTGQVACCTQYWLTDPSSALTNPP
jgi:hypothetical protein